MKEILLQSIPRLCFFLLSLAILFPSLVYAHGVHCDISDAVMVKAYFEGGSPMAGVEVKIYAPGNDKEPHITTRTNQEGQTFFRPHKAGLWIVIVKDKSGHALRKDFTVDEKMALSRPSKGDLTYMQKIVMALCVIWGLVGTGLFFKSRKSG